MKHKEKFLIYTWLGSLIFIVATGIFFCFQRPSSEIIKAEQSIVSISEKIRAFYRNRPDYWGLSNTSVISQKLYDGTIVEGKMLNNLGKEIVVGGDSSGSQVMPGSKSFVVTYKELNRAECIELSAFRGQEQDRLGLIAMSIRNETGVFEFSWGNKGLPLSKSQAKKYCAEKNDIMWTFE